VGHGIEVVDGLSNGDDLQLGEVAPEAFGLVEALATLELEGDSLHVTELVNHFRGDLATFNEGCADRHAVAFTAKQNLAESYFGIDFGIEFLNVEGVALLDAVLFTACFDYCVGHGRMGKCFVRQRAGGESITLANALQGFFGRNRERI
jgi:hypothetical protein